MSIIKSAVADGVLTLLWVFCSSTFGIFTSLIAASTGVQGLAWPSLFITTVLIFLFVLVFNVIAATMGGASFNPTGTASFYAAGCQLYGRVNMVQDLKRELGEKESIIEALKATVAAMEKEESKKAREVDILRQSLRIIVNSTKMSETAGLTKTTKSLSRLRERVNNCSK